MTATEKVERATEPYRKQISWFSILTGLLIFTALTTLFTLREHNFAREDRNHAMVQRNRVAVLEDRIRDALIHSTRPLVVYYVGEDAWGDEKLISWPTSAVDLLGWTADDIRKDGLDIIIPDDYELDHATAMLKTIEKPDSEQKTVVLHKNAVHKDGSRVPVRITAWALGGGTRALAAYIEAESRVAEKK